MPDGDLVELSLSFRSFLRS